MELPVVGRCDDGKEKDETEDDGTDAEDNETDAERMQLIPHWAMVETAEWCLLG